jgi:hypothetical protein
VTTADWVSVADGRILPPGAQTYAGVCARGRA